MSSEDDPPPTTEENDQRQDRLASVRAISEFVIGGISYAFNKLIVHPIELWKLITQCKRRIPNVDVSYSASRIIAQRVRENGVLVLWDGFRWELLRFVGAKFGNYSSSSISDTLLSRFVPKSSVQLVVRHILSGVISTGANLVFLSPLEALGTYISVCNPKKSAYEIISSLSESDWFDALSALYAGAGTALLSTVVYRAVYYSLFQTLGPKLKQTKRRAYFALGGMAVTFAAGLAAYPFDTIRRHMMLLAMQGRPQSTLQTARLILNESGPMGLLAGAATSMFHSFLGAFCIALIEFSLVALSNNANREAEETDQRQRRQQHRRFGHDDTRHGGIDLHPH